MIPDLNSIETIFWIAFGVLAYTYLIYPIILLVVERVMYQPIKKDDIEPAVSILIPVYNEEARIAQKLDNLLKLDYPKEKMEIIVASDGSTDNTADIVRSYHAKGIKLVEFHTRRGKTSVLNDMIPKLEGEIAILADVRQRLEEDVVRKLVSNFADPEVGGVSGELVFEKPDEEGIAKGLDFYWHYEKWLRNKEAGIHSTVGGTGALFALRRELYQPIPGETILDDVVIPFKIVHQGYRVVMELGARAWDHVHVNWEREFERKARTLSGNFQILFSLKRMGPGLLGPIGFQYISHKVLRLLGPLCMIAMLYSCMEIINLQELSESRLALYTTLFWGQVAFYILAVIGPYLKSNLLRLPGLSLPYSLTLMQIAVVTGLLRYGSGRDDVLWERAHALNPANIQQRIWRLIFDSTLFSVGFVIAFYVRYLGSPLPEAIQSYTRLTPSFNIMGITLAIPLVMLIPLTVFYFYRVNEPRTEDITPEYFLTLLKGVFYSTLTLFFIIYIRRGEILQVQVAGGSELRVVSMPTAVIIIGFFINCILIGGWRLALMWLKEAGNSISENAMQLALISRTENGKEEPAFLQEAFQPTACKTSVIPIEQDETRLANALEDANPHMVIIDATAGPSDRILSSINIAEEKGMPTGLFGAGFELLLGGTKPRLISFMPVLDPAVMKEAEFMCFVKRTIDILLGLCGAVLCGPFLTIMLAASAIKISNAKVGKAPRLGKNGKTDWALRLRHANGWPSWWRCAARIALSGGQLISGKLTLVGPRPLLPSHKKKLHPMVSGIICAKHGIVYLPRIIVPSGSDLNPVDAAILYYCKNWNIALDIQILLSKIIRRSRCPADIDASAHE